jgi:hypothetical protein
VSYEIELIVAIDLHLKILHQNFLKNVTLEFVENNFELQIQIHQMSYLFYVLKYLSKNLIELKMISLEFHIDHTMKDDEV